MEVHYTNYSDFTINDPVHFSSEIKKLSRYDQLQVLKIILESDNSSYTENSNGSYVSLHTIKDKKVLYKIHQFINSSKMNKERVKEEESKREEEIKQYLSIISEKNTKISEEKQGEDELEDELIGEKVVLKKNKVKFSGNKGKLLKSFRNVSKINKSNIKTSVSTKQKKTLFITESALDDEELEDIDDEETMSTQGYDEDEDEDEDEEDDVKDIDICEEEAEIEHEEIEEDTKKKKKEDEEDDDEEEDEEEDDEEEDDEDDDEDDE